MDLSQLMATLGSRPASSAGPTLQAHDPQAAAAVAAGFASMMQQQQQLQQAAAAIPPQQLQELQRQREQQELMQQQLQLQQIGAASAASQAASGGPRRKEIKLFLGGISPQTQKEQLLKHFSRFGHVVDAVAMYKDGKHRGFGFVSFDDEAAADAACAEPQQIEGRTVDVRRAVAKDQAPAPQGKAAQDPKPPQKDPKIFIGGLAQSTTNEMLKEHFSKYGQITDSVVMERDGKSRGFGFVTFEMPESVSAVLSEPQEIDGRTLDCKEADGNRDRSERSGMGYSWGKAAGKGIGPWGGAGPVAGQAAAAAATQTSGKGTGALAANDLTAALASMGNLNNPAMMLAMAAMLKGMGKGAQAVRASESMPY
eukprot:gnl/TRDRNA2_/TRDRNA2_171511_c0_seq3.p1 gnl/TRDRNA2_/TRDRNA2_171511_c0~~gnl/TRDRNA2_/TRDRNA2_171511_c0_seq3.p1  ORF type:complete len:368 (+),score=98.46 gnl/TRDRNA2_/TRDRNA2_171511_c0_seq3:104-1207(+)